MIGCIVGDPMCGGIFGLCDECKVELHHRRRVEAIRAARGSREAMHDAAAENPITLFGMLLGAVTGAAIGSSVDEHRKTKKGKKK